MISGGKGLNVGKKTATEEIRSPLVLRREWGTERNCCEDDLSDPGAEYRIKREIYTGTKPLRALETNCKIFKSIQYFIFFKYFTGNQCKCVRTGVMCLAAVFLTFCSRERVEWVNPIYRELQ